MFSFTALQSLVGQGLSIFKALSHSDKPHSVVLLWTSDQPEQRPLPDNTQHSQETDTSPPGFEPANLASKWSQTHVLDSASTRIEVYTIRKTKGNSKCGLELASGFSYQYQTSNYWCPPIHNFTKTSPPVPVVYCILQYLKVHNYYRQLLLAY
jgi:hypothetical protein